MTPEDIFDRIMAGDISSNRTGHFGHPASKFSFIVCCFVLSLYLSVLQINEKGANLSLISSCLIALYAVQAIDFRKSFLLKSIVIIVCCITAICYINFGPAVSYDGFKQLKSIILTSFPLNIIVKYISLQALCIIGIMALATKTITKVYAMDTVWLGKFIFVEKARHAFHLAVMTYFLFRRYFSKNMGDVMYATKTKWYITKKKLGTSGALRESTRLFLKRFFTEFADVAAVAETIVNERDLLNTQKYKSARYIVVAEDYPIVLLSFTVFISAVFLSVD